MTTKTEFAFRSVADVKLCSVNFRKEIHGDEHVQAVDLTMSVDVPNTALDVIQPGLREALYWNAEAANGQSNLDGVAETLPNLRFPHLNDGKFSIGSKKNKLAGYDLTIEYGLGDEQSNMAFDCCKVVKRVIEAKEGGTIHLTWQVQYSGDRLDQETCGKLALLEQDLIAITLIPPVVSAEPEPEEPMENPLYMGDNDEDPQTPEDLFCAGTDDAEQQAALESDER